MTGLSVVAPMRDVAPHAPDLLLSLARNAGPGIELIVVDDGSADRTPELIEEHRHLLPGLTVLRHDRAVGLSGARNAGMDAASGRYVTFLDGDDWLAAGHLRALVDAIDVLGCDFVRVDHTRVRGRQRVVERAPMGRRDVVLNPRDAILPVHGKSMVDYPYAWAASTGVLSAMSCGSTTSCIPPKTALGSGVCTAKCHRSRSSRWPGCSIGAAYRAR